VTHLSLEERIPKETVAQHAVPLPLNQLRIVNVDESSILAERRMSMPELEGQWIACKT
jgi:hypothetical protein